MARMIAIQAENPSGSAPGVDAWFRRDGLPAAGVCLGASFPEVISGSQSFVARRLRTVQTIRSPITTRMRLGGEFPLWKPLHNCGVPSWRS